MKIDPRTCGDAGASEQPAVLRAEKTPTQAAPDSSTGKVLTPPGDKFDTRLTASTGAVYTMSDIKRKADAILRENNAKLPAEIRPDDNRDERIQLARLRMNSGFYTRPEVIEEIARKISDGLDR